MLAIGVLLVVILMQGIALWMTPIPQPAGPAADRQPVTATAAPADVKAALAPFGQVSALQFQSELGLYQATVGKHIVYVTPDGRFAMVGNLYDLASKTNLTSKARAKLRKQVVAGLDPDKAITFSPKGETRAVVWVFIDVSCPYCHKFHQQINDYLARGIEVRYLAFPRAGPDTEDWKRMEAVWCADQPRVALGHAYNNVQLQSKPDCDSPVRAQYRAGLAAGLRGTPMILTADGEVPGGYLAPRDLAAYLGLDNGSKRASSDQATQGQPNKG